MAVMENQMKTRFDNQKMEVLSMGHTNDVRCRMVWRMSHGLQPHEESHNYEEDSQLN